MNTLKIFGKYKSVILLLLLATSIASGQIADGVSDLSIECPDSVLKVGENAAFKVIMPSDIKLKNLVFNWTVSSGEIISGQRTREIKVSLPLENTTLTITVKVDGLPSLMKNTDSCISIVVPPPSAELVRELSVNVSYEVLLSELDNLFIRLQNYPSSKGYIIIFAEKGKNIRNFVREIQIKNYIRLRRYDPERIVLIRGKNNAEAGMQFWTVPSGVDISEIQNLKADEDFGADDWSYDLSNIKKPFILGTQICDYDCESFNFKLYAEYLKANPKSRGNIVIYETTQTKFRQTAKEIIDELVNLGVLRRQLKAIFVRTKENNSVQPIEIWLLP